jgi:AraC-like DNA-binding protein
LKLKDLFETVSHRTGAVVNLHARHPRVLDLDDLQLLPRQYFHHGEYCQFRKLRGQQPACAQNKARSLNVAKAGRTFSGSCPYGVWELAKPVLFRERVIAVLYLGHFFEGRSLAEVDGEVFEGQPLEKVSKKKERELRRYANFLADFIELACQRWVERGNGWNIERSAQGYGEVCQKFIASRYTDPIRLQDLADDLGLTANHLGAMITKQLGAPFRVLLEEYRVEQAKVLLKSELQKSITQIAFECGFSDGNYFSTIFKKAVGLAPRAYRKT